MQPLPIFSLTHLFTQEFPNIAVSGLQMSRSHIVAEPLQQAAYEAGSGEEPGVVH